MGTSFVAMCDCCARTLHSRATVLNRLLQEIGPTFQPEGN